MDRLDLNWWKNEYPELTEEEIVDIFEAFGEEYEGDLLAEQEATPYTDYLKPKRKTGLMGVLQNILDPDK